MSVRLGSFCSQTGTQSRPRKDKPEPRYCGCPLGGGGFQREAEATLSLPLMHSEA